jgi:hypothetical protein
MLGRSAAEAIDLTETKTVANAIALAKSAADVTEVSLRTVVRMLFTTIKKGGGRNGSSLTLLI